MIAFVQKHKNAGSSWQDGFLAMLPEIESRLRHEFRKLDPDSKAEAVCEGIAHCLIAYIRLHERGRADCVTPGSLVFYSARHVRRGRPAAGRMNARDPLSRYAQIGKGFRMDPSAGAWIGELVEDNRATVPDQVAAKIDVAVWLSSLPRLRQQIARDLALGGATQDVARTYGLTAGRISQLRRWFEKSWADFHGETATVSA